MPNKKKWFSVGDNLSFFRCECKNELFLNRIYHDLYRHYEESISEEADESINTELDFGIKDIDKKIAETVISLFYKCPKCNKKLKLKLLCEFSYYYEDLDKTMVYLDELFEFTIIDIENAKLCTRKGIFRGNDILTTIRWLILRWSIISKKTVIISPFIDINNWKFLYEIQEEQLHQVNIRGGMGRVITRKIQLKNGRFFNIEKWLKQEIKNLKKECDERMETLGDSLCFTGEGFCGHQVMEKLYKKVTFQIGKKNFHAKLYAGISEDKSEVVITSFNMITSELKQLESFAFIDMQTDKLNRQIKKIGRSK